MNAVFRTVHLQRSNFDRVADETETELTSGNLVIPILCRRDTTTSRRV